MLKPFTAFMHGDVFLPLMKHQDVVLPLNIMVDAINEYNAK